MAQPRLFVGIEILGDGELITLFSQNIVGDEVECVIFHCDDLEELNQIGQLVRLIAVFVVTLHFLGVGILFGPTDRGDINRPEIALLSGIGINVADVPAGITVVVPIEDEIDTVFFEQGFPVVYELVCDSLVLLRNERYRPYFCFA